VRALWYVRVIVAACVRARVRERCGIKELLRTVTDWTWRTDALLFRVLVCFINEYKPAETNGVFVFSLRVVFVEFFVTP
jgi:hypothetical protein